MNNDGNKDETGRMDLKSWYDMFFSFVLCGSLTAIGVIYFIDLYNALPEHVCVFSRNGEFVRCNAQMNFLNVIWSFFTSLLPLLFFVIGVGGLFVNGLKVRVLLRGRK